MPRAMTLSASKPYRAADAATQSSTLLISRSGDAGSFGAAGQLPVPEISKLSVAWPWSTCRWVRGVWSVLYASSPQMKSTTGHPSAGFSPPGRRR